MGKLFDRLNKIGSNPIDEYLKERDFYEDKMRPRFLDGFGHDDLALDRPCLKHDSMINGESTLRIFINEVDIYYEVETPWRSYGTSCRYNAKEYDSVEAIDALLDEILERVLE